MDQTVWLPIGLQSVRLTFEMPSNLPLLVATIAMAVPCLADEKGGSGPAGSGSAKGTLDDLVKNERIWEVRLDQFVRTNPKLKFHWLSSAKTGARSVDSSLSLNGMRVGETVIRAKDGKISEVSISVYNRGDHGQIDEDQFSQTDSFWVDYWSHFTKSEPQNRSRSKDNLTGVNRRIWFKGDSAYLLETSTAKKPEFIRIRVEPERSAVARLESVPRPRDPVSLSDLPRNVRRLANGDRVIRGIPMVDQGNKGYCAVASAERVFRYYGLAVDQHELAQMSSASARFGTTPGAIVSALKKAVSKVHLRCGTLIDWDPKELIREVENYNSVAEKQGLPVFSLKPLDQAKYYAKLDPDIFLAVRTRSNRFRTFQTQVQRSIDKGVPLLWAVQLGIYSENEIPQALGGHMRLIIGYNEKTGEILYSDSWGEGHGEKRMRTDRGYAITNGLYVVNPSR